MHSSPTLRPRIFAPAPCLRAAAWLCIALAASAAAAESIVVNTLVDAEAADGFCSLREAILAANTDSAVNECPAGSGVDHIEFAAAASGTLSLGDHLPEITDSLAIHGPGTDELILDGVSLYRPISTPSSGDFELAVQDLTLANGLQPSAQPLGGGGGAFVGSGVLALFERVKFLANRSEHGGGLDALSAAWVAVVDCWFEGNSVDGPQGKGGALANSGSATVLRVVRSAFVDNHAPEGIGGGLYLSRATVSIEASTFSGNSAGVDGGAVYATTATQAPSDLSIRDSTITRNTAGTELSSGDGGGLHLRPGSFQPMTVSIQNSVVADNFDLTGDDVPDVLCGDHLTEIAVTGSNLIGAHDGCDSLIPAGNPNADGDFVGTLGALLDPVLEALGDHGGPTPTHRPLVGPLSPLIDHGTCPAVLADQRFYGLPGAAQRIRDLPGIANGASSDGCDIGAFEVQASPMQPGRVFADGFEHGHTLRWSSELP